ncbi:MAG TPA: AMP-binding protein [Vicinamibacterales bacterium]|jgi:long-chain acyl-CoA synthetase|nr:AMP-binding protein [Vicinamibacterales bacterium]
MRRDTLLDFFRDFSAGRGEFLAYDDGFRARAYTYGETGEAARGFAARLQAAGIAKGDKVLFWSENRPEWIIALWGCLLTGAIAVPIDYRASLAFLRQVARIVDAKLLLAGDDVLVNDLDIGIHTWKLSELDWRKMTGTFAPVTVTRDDVAEIIFTSGATAEPKGVVLTHRNVLANIIPVEKEIQKYEKYGRPFFPLRFLNLLPLSHMFGQAMATFVPPMLAGTVVFIRGYNPHEIVRQIHKRRISCLVSVPKILDVLADHVTRLDPRANEMSPPGERFWWRWWRYRTVHRAFGLKFWAFLVGAAPLDSKLEEFWSRLGFVVVQGYGLTEAAPIVTLNHPFGTDKGSVGKPIAGVDVKIAPDGEILVRGDNVTAGYYGAAEATRAAFDDGWFHTGDIGEVDASGRLFIRGRKKEMIVTPEGLNVFPEDVERVVNAIAGVKDSAAVGVTHNGEERVHVALILEPGGNAEEIVRAANAQLADHQRIRGAARWPGAEFPRTEGTRKLKRHEIRTWLQAGAPPVAAGGRGDSVEAVIERYTGGRPLRPGMTIEELGLSSLERVEMMGALEDALNTNLDETAFANASTVADLQRLAAAPAATEAVPEPVTFPRWNRTWPVRVVRGVSQAIFLLPLARAFAWIDADGLQHLEGLQGPVIFAANHQSHMDTPVILAALPSKWRGRVATAMAKEFFKAHFFPGQFTRREWFTNSLNYWLSAAFFNTFPLPQREAGARQTLRYAGELIGDGYSILLFPEGKRTEQGEINAFRPGIGMMASKLGVPVVPVRLTGVDRVLHHSWKMAKPGRVRVSFGAPMRLAGEDYADLTRQVEAAVRKMGN